MAIVHDHLPNEECDIECIRQMEREQEDLQATGRSDTVHEVIDGRQSVYGEVTDGMIRIAQMWSAYLGKDCIVQAHDVAAMMILMKLVRFSQSPDYSDHIDDIEGYSDIIRQVIGKDMIHARSVSEYQMKKHDL